jgi:hypothetical protein
MRFFSFLTPIVASVAVVQSFVQPPISPRGVQTLEELLARDNVELVPRQSITDALTGLTDLLASLKQFLNKEFLDDTHTVVTNLAALLADPLPAQARSLVSEAGKLLTSVGPLLTVVGQIDLGGLVTSLKPLLELLGKADLAGLLNNAISLLSADFVKQVKQLIADVQPVSTLAVS